MMTATHSRPPQLPGKDEQAQAKEASRQLARLLPAADQPLRLVVADNHHEMVSLPPSALRLLAGILTQLGQGRSVEPSLECGRPLDLNHAAMAAPSDLGRRLTSRPAHDA